MRRAPKHGSITYNAITGTMGATIGMSSGAALSSMGASSVDFELLVWIRENPNEYAVVKLMPAVYEAVQAVVEEKIKAFGSVDKAVV